LEKKPLRSRQVVATIATLFEGKTAYEKNKSLPAVEPSSSLHGAAMRFTEKISLLQVLLQGLFVALG